MRVVRQAVDELRVRLYRPAPPPGAVAAYLDAVRAADRLRTTSASQPSAAPRRRRVPIGAGLLAAVAVLVVGGVLALRTPPAPAGHEAGGAEAVGTSAPSPGWPPVTGVPIGRLHGEGHAGAARFSAAGEHAVIGVNCTGEGTLSVRIGPDDPVVLVCDRGAVAFALVASRTPLQRFRLEVVPDGPVRWSAAAGAIDLPPA